MIVVKLKGGLGNQMFQYAFGRALATELKKELVIDLEFLLDRSPKQNFIFRDFDLDLFHLKKYSVLNDQKKKKFYKSSIFNKKPVFFNEISFNFQDFSSVLTGKKIYIDGYWQSYKYFQKIENELRKEFTFKIPLTEDQQLLKSKIQSSTSVCINFRRTDFVTITSAIQTHGIPSIEYYHKALELLQQKIGNELELFVFSDDIPWCEKNFKTPFSTFFVSHNQYKGERFSAYLQLMKSCKHFIIPNSTFAWWAAWLGESHDKIVITPENWFADKTLQSQTQDLRPESWICL